MWPVKSITVSRSLATTVVYARHCIVSQLSRVVGIVLQPGRNDHGPFDFPALLRARLETGPHLLFAAPQMAQKEGHADGRQIGEAPEECFIVHRDRNEPAAVFDVQVDIRVRSVEYRGDSGQVNQAAPQRRAAQTVVTVLS